eukprot:131937-Chlamydomonas_euryale.AAC.1
MQWAEGGPACHVTGRQVRPACHAVNRKRASSMPHIGKGGGRYAMSCATDVAVSCDESVAPPRAI